MRKVIFAVAVFAVWGASGCAIQRAADAERAQSELIGFTRAELFNCAGVPVRKATESGLEYLVYNSAGDSPVAGFGQTTGGSTFLTGIARKRYCEATFTLKDGVVTKIMYTGKTGGLLTKGSVCFTIIENCLKK